MTIWLILFGGIFLLGASGLLYLIYSVKQLPIIAALAAHGHLLPWLTGAAIVIIPLAVIYMAWTYMNAMVVLIHLTFFFLVADGVKALAQRFMEQPISPYVTAGAAILVTLIYLGVGWVQANHVAQTDYTVKTSKNVGHLRVALIGDSHLGSTFDAEGFAKHLKTIEAQNPDMIVLAGDYVDERTTKAEMIKASRALKDVKTKYGVYFVFGNHDKGIYARGARDFTGDDLVAELEKNGVIVLQDESMLIDNRFYIIGRQDASEIDFGSSRANMDQLVQGLDTSKYMLVLDHQPRDYAAQAKSNVDLVLSGHTHGGQMIPLMQIIQLFKVGGNDRLYGMEQRDNTNFIVTSGISDWALQFKTGTKSEYVIVDIKQQ